MPKSPRRILFGTTSGVSLALLGSLPSELARRGWVVHLVSSGPQELLASSQRPYVSHHEVALDRLPNPVRDIQSLFSLFRLVKEIQPDIVVGATPKASLLLMIASALNLIPIRVYFLWGLRLESATGMSRRILGVAEWVTANVSTNIVSVSPSLSRAFNNLRLTESDKLVVLGNGSSKGINLEVFRPPSKLEKPALQELARSIGLKKGIPVVGYFGRITRDKGIDILSEARTKLSMMGIDHQLLVVGDNEYPEGFSWADAPGLRPPVVLGPRKDVPELLRLVEVLCLPTFREGLPNVCLEASSSSVPIVATRVTGTVDCVEEGVNGLLVEPHSPDALADGLKRILTDETLTQALRNSSRAWVSQRFEEKIVVDLHADFLESLVSQPA